MRGALRAVGLGWRRGGRRVAVIDPDAAGMTPQNTALWLSPPGRRVKLLGTPDECAPFDPDGSEADRTVGKQTRAHHAEFAARGRRPFLFHGVTHVLRRGTIPLDLAQVVTV